MKAYDELVKAAISDLRSELLRLRLDREKAREHESRSEQQMVDGEIRRVIRSIALLGSAPDLPESKDHVTWIVWRSGRTDEVIRVGASYYLAAKADEDRSHYMTDQDGRPVNRVGNFICREDQLTEVFRLAGKRGAVVTALL
jgi:hypothetical protein